MSFFFLSLLTICPLFELVSTMCRYPLCICFFSVYISFLFISSLCIHLFIYIFSLWYYCFRGSTITRAKDWEFADLFRLLENPICAFVILRPTLLAISICKKNKFSLKMFILDCLIRNFYHDAHSQLQSCYKQYV